MTTVSGNGLLSYKTPTTMELVAFSSTNEVIMNVDIKRKDSVTHFFTEGDKYGVLHVSSSEFKRLASNVPCPTATTVPTNLCYNSCSPNNVTMLECAGVLICFPN